MDHPFLTKRQELQDCNEKICICTDILTLLCIKLDDLSKVLARKDEEIKDDEIREVVLRRACCLGMLVDKLNAYDGVLIPDQVRQVWPTFLSGTKVNTSTLRELVTTICANSKRTSITLAEIEDDGNSSSYSDYSDSHTISSDDGEVCKRSKRVREGESEDGGSEEGESEEESEDASPQPFTQRRR